MRPETGMRGGVRLAHDWLDQALPPNVTVGDGSWVYSAFAFLHYQSQKPVGVRVGDHSGIYNGTFFDLGPNGEVEVGDYCSIVGAIISTNGKVAIGDYTFIAHEVVIADHPFVTLPQEAHSASGAGPRLGDDVWVGMGAVILGSVTIGDGAVVAARALVTEDVPAHTVVAGNPARVVRRLGTGRRGGDA